MQDHTSVRITIASDVDYERLTAEIFVDDEFVALLSQEQGPERLVVELPRSMDAPEQGLRKIAFDVLLQALTEAKRKLVSGIS